MKKLLKLALFAIVFANCAFTAELTQMLIIVGTDIHRPGTHECAAGGRLLAHTLENLTNLSGIDVTVAYEWPTDPAIKASVSTVVFIGDTFPPQRFENTSAAIEDLTAMMARGCGIVGLHWATGLGGEDVGRNGEHPLLQWLGGYFANRTCPHHESIAKIYPAAEITPSGRQHPVENGWTKFVLHDEPYTNIYFGPEAVAANSRVTPIATSLLPPEEPREETVAWTIDRPDGGRGFAVVMPHFYQNWALPDLRRLILNGIVWTAHLPVPTEGVNSVTPVLSAFEPKSVEPISRKPSSG